MNKIIELLLYRHRRFKGETYFRHHFPFMLVISALFAIFLADTYIEFLGITVGFIVLDALLAFWAWLYYPTDL